MTKLTIRLLTAGLILFQVFLPYKAGAQGDLLVTPRRVVLDGRDRSMDLSLANIGKDTATYTISFVADKDDCRMVILRLSPSLTRARNSPAPTSAFSRGQSLSAPTRFRQ